MKLCGFEIGLDRPFFLIAGPCVIESEQLQVDVAGQLKDITSALGIPFIFKSSFDKANRSSGSSFRGPGLDKGLEVLAKVKQDVDVPVLTDVHTEAEVPQVAAVVDVLQTPAFLCRQTDFIRAVAQSGRPVNIKKGQFLAPHDMKNVIDKAREAAAEKGLPSDVFMACERGVSFGYNNLVSDMRSLAIMRETGAPVVFDATHSVQLPACSWKPIPTPPMPCRTAPMPCRCGTCAPCSSRCWPSIKESRVGLFLKIIFLSDTPKHHAQRIHHCIGHRDPPRTIRGIQEMEQRSHACAWCRNLRARRQGRGAGRRLEPGAHRDPEVSQLRGGARLS